MIQIRPAQKTDVDLFFKWANDDLSRKNSYTIQKIDYPTHVKWFHSQFDDGSVIMLVHEYDNGMPIGQVRFQRNEDETIIGIIIDKDFRGQLLAKKLIEDSCDYFFERFPTDTINAYIKKDNLASIKAFKHAGFEHFKDLDHKGFPSVLYRRSK